MSGVLPDMRARLLAAVPAFNTPIALGRLPDQPDTVLALISRPSRPSKDLDGRNLPAHERLSVQLVARVGKDAGIAAAESIAVAAYRALVGRHVVISVGSGPARIYDTIYAEHVPAHTGYDANDRPLVSTTLSMQRHGQL